MARRTSRKTAGKRSGPSSIRKNVARSSPRDCVPRPACSPSCQVAASSASSSASGRTVTRCVYRSVRRRSWKAFDRFFPGTRVFGSPAMLGQTLVQKSLLPILQRNLTGRCGDAVPERLHVVDLILDRQRVEPWRRQRLRHSRKYTTRPEPGFSALGGSQIRQPRRHFPLLPTRSWTA